MKVSATYDHCSIYVEGIDLTCPFCKTPVKSGECHQCSKPRSDEPAKIITSPAAPLNLNAAAYAAVKALR